MITIEEASNIAKKHFGDKYVVKCAECVNKQYFIINAVPIELYKEAGGDFRKIMGFPPYTIDRNSKKIEKRSFYDFNLFLGR